MKSLFAPLRIFATERYFATLALIFAGIVLSFFSNKEYLPWIFKLTLPWLLLALVMTKDLTRQAGLYLVICICLIISIAVNYFVSANHGFVITYVGLALLIATSAGKEEVMRRLAFYLLSILMGVALIQKLASPYYMSGNLIGDFVISGEIFSVLFTLTSFDWPNLIQENLRAEGQVLEAMPNAAGTFPINITPFMQIMIVALTAASIAFQLVLEVALIFRKRLGMWLHYALMVFVLIIYSTRDENVFLSLNCLLGYALTDETTKAARVWYVVFVIYLLGTRLMGIRPFFLL